MENVKPRFKLQSSVKKCHQWMLSYIFTARHLSVQKLYSKVSLLASRGQFEKSLVTYTEKQGSNVTPTEGSR